jgi:hypothetical protein
MLGSLTIECSGELGANVRHKMPQRRFPVVLNEYMITQGNSMNQPANSLGRY